MTTTQIPRATGPETHPPTTAPPAVAARGLVRRFGRGEAAVTALDGVSLTVERGEFLAVMGPSGSGKSTLMHLLAGLDRPSEGEVWIDGTPLGRAGDADLVRLRRRAVGFVFQSFNLLPTLTVEENVRLPLRLAGTRPDRAWVDELLGAVGLTGRRRHRPAELSGGQRQRTAIARALVTRPAVVFADEPTGALDSASGGAVLDLLRRTADDFGRAVVMVTHDPRAAATADRVLFLADGRVTHHATRPTPAEILATLKGE